MDEVGWVGMPIIPTFKGFAERVRAEAGHVVGSAGTEAGTSYGRNFGAKASASIHEHFRNAAKYIVGPLVGAFAVEKVGELVKESIGAASDLEAARNRAHVVFGQSAEDVDRFGEHAAKSLGLSHLSALQAETGFGLLGQRMGLTDKENAQFSQRFVRTADDLAAFNHSDPGAAFLALQRGVAGATRGLKPYGVLVDSTSIKAEALADGILKPVKNQAAIHAAQVRLLVDQQTYTAAVTAHGKESLEARKAEAALGLAQNSLNTATAGAVPPLTQQQKMLAATKLILQQTKQEQGSFADSTHHLYGEQRQLSASFADAKDRLGKGLLPVATDFVRYLNGHLVPAVDEASKWFEHKGAPAIHHFEDQLRPLANSALPAFATGFHDAYEAAHKLLPVAKSIFDIFNSLPDWAQKTAVVGGGVAFLGRNQLKKQASSALSSIVSKAEPVPVFVTNPGFGGAGGVAGGGKGTGILTGAEEVGGAAASGGVLSRLFGRATLGRLAGAALSAPALITLGDAGNEVRSGPGHVIELQPKDLKGSPFSPTTSGLPDAATLKMFHATAEQARQILGLEHLIAVGSHADQLTTQLGKASRGFDLVGHSAASNSASAITDITGLQRRIAAINPKPVDIYVNDRAALTSLKELDAIRLHNKFFTVVQRNQVIEQAGGPGRATGTGSGGPTQHHKKDNSGSSGGGEGRPLHVHLHVDKKQFADVVIPMMDDYHQAQSEWQRRQDENR